ncbi:hypothetical protein EJD97_025522 [Solanum chilense]|uniref:CCHC-type domain-containing protein n=1 Tax=Solanum chilense TaxID=4083 RepID=A0A6N2C3P3_SOLCI|nr:hypothetical protein EJD97_025522 [Solanum chilense]
MNTRRTPARRVEENDVQNEVPPYVEQDSKVLKVIKSLLWKEVGEDPEEFITEVYKTVHAMGVTSRKKAQLALVANLVREECPSAMLHVDITVARLILYTQSIEESKLKRIARNLKRGGSSDQDQPRVRKRAQTQEEPRSAKVKFERGGGSQNEKPICFTCGKRHYGKCLAGTNGCFGCGKDDHKVRDCTTIAARGRESNKVAPNVPKDDVQKNEAFLCTPE